MVRRQTCLWEIAGVGRGLICNRAYTLAGQTYSTDSRSIVLWPKRRQVKSRECVGIELESKTGRARRAEAAMAGFV